MHANSIVSLRLGLTSDTYCWGVVRSVGIGGDHCHLGVTVVSDGLVCDGGSDHWSCCHGVWLAYRDSVDPSAFARCVCRASVWFLRFILRTSIILVSALIRWELIRPGGERSPVVQSVRSTFINQEISLKVTQDNCSGSGTSWVYRQND